MSYLKNISENSYFNNLEYKITTPYDEFISSNINFELYVILEFIINSYMPFGLILTKSPHIYKLFRSNRNFCLLIPHSKMPKQHNFDFLYNFIDERKHIETYGMLEFASSFGLLIDKFILSYLPKFKTIKELYLKTKLSGKHIPYRIDKMIKHFKEESNKVIEDYDSPF